MFGKSILTVINSLITNVLEQRFEKLPSNVTIGKHTYGVVKGVNKTYQIRPGESITIGKFCSIAPGVKLMSGGEHRTDLVSTYPLKTLLSKADGINYDATTKGPLRIVNDVWIGFGALVLSGVTVGDGAVIGAMSVVTTDVPPYAVVAGNPARIVRYRFTPEQIQSLLKIAWWDWNDDEIIRNEKDFYSDVEQFIARYSSYKKENK
jgi:acetyltransferase-like isoleucine patch superfamily enzyme